MKLSQFFKDPTRAAAFRAWLEDPMTKAVVELMEESAVPVPVDFSKPGNHGEQSLYVQGYNLGQSDFLRTLKNLEIAGTNLDKIMTEKLRATYGSEKKQKQPTA